MLWLHLTLLCLQRCYWPQLLSLRKHQNIAFFTKISRFFSIFQEQGRKQAWLQDRAGVAPGNGRAGVAPGRGSAGSSNLVLKCNLGLFNARCAGRYSGGAAAAQRVSHPSQVPVLGLEKTRTAAAAQVYATGAGAPSGAAWAALLCCLGSVIPRQGRAFCEVLCQGGA